MSISHYFKKWRLELKSIFQVADMRLFILIKTNYNLETRIELCVVMKLLNKSQVFKLLNLHQIK